MRHSGPQPGRKLWFGGNPSASEVRSLLRLLYTNHKGVKERLELAMAARQGRETYLRAAYEGALDGLRWLREARRDLR